MSFIQTFRAELTQTIQTFRTTYGPLSQEREAEIQRVLSFVQYDNPLTLRSQIELFANNLSSGFIAIFPFLEVNRLKKALLNLIEQPSFQENAILKAMLSETALYSYQGDTQHRRSTQSFDTRLGQLEVTASKQAERISTLETDIENLRYQNKRLEETIQTLEATNNELTLKNQNLVREIATLKQQGGGVTKEEYNRLLQENFALRAQLKRLQGSPSPPTQSEKTCLLGKPTAPSPVYPNKKGPSAYAYQPLPTDENSSSQQNTLPSVRRWELK